jgi:hypothetical protein
MGGAELPLGGTVEWLAASHYAVVNKSRLPQIFRIWPFCRSCMIESKEKTDS